VVLEDLVDFGVRLVLKRGAEPSFPRLAAPDWVRGTMNAAPVSADSFRVPAINQPMQVIGVVSMQLLTTAERVEPAVRDGETVADPARDLVKIAVVERHHASGRIGVAFATNVGLRRGAYASTVAHDAHNIVVVGVDDHDMAACVRRLGELGGGIVVAEGGQVVDELPLPVAGLMSDRPLQEVHDRLLALEARLRGMGVAGEAPFMTLSFLALSVIPELKITDRGLVDVGRFRIVPLAAS
jgi:adenine deaminase